MGEFEEFRLADDQRGQPGLWPQLAMRRLM